MTNPVWNPDVVGLTEIDFKSLTGLGVAKKFIEILETKRKKCAGKHIKKVNKT